MSFVTVAAQMAIQAAVQAAMGKSRDEIGRSAAKTAISGAIGGAVGGGLADPGQLTQLALGDAIALPQDAQKHPLPDGNRVDGQPDLHGALNHAQQVLDHMGHAVVGNGLAPFAQPL